MNDQYIQWNFSSCNNNGNESLSTQSTGVPFLLPSPCEFPCSNLLPEKTSTEEEPGHLPKICTKGGVKKPFPVKLWELLDHIDTHEPEIAHIISWQQPDGRCFRVHDKKLFETKVQSKFFDQSNYTSFRRQLNLWGFKRVTQRGVNCGAYFHPLCRQGEPYLCRLMRRPVKEPRTPNNGKRPPLHTAVISDGKTPACATPPPPLKADGGAAANCAIITPTLVVTTPANYFRIDDSITNLLNNCYLGNNHLQRIAGGGDGCCSGLASMHSRNYVEIIAPFAENTTREQIQHHSENCFEPIEDIHSYQESSFLLMQFASYMKEALKEDFTET